MASAIAISPGRAFRDEIARRGGAPAARCFQCATCSSVCDLATPERAFPRRQVLWAQWGLADRLAADPAIWLCHQCNDCSVRCPRDARPGDVMQAIRAAVIEHLGAPRFLARLVGRAGTTWPLLFGAPILFWALLVWAVTGFTVPRTPLVYHDVVPDWLVDAVFVPAAAFAATAAAVGARRCWSAWGAGATGPGPVRALAAVAVDVLAHRRFARCGAAHPRRSGHLLLMWGFLGAALTTTCVAVADYVFGMELPLGQLHPVKLLGNASAVLLTVGVVWLAVNRLARAEASGASSAFDHFFLALVVVLVFSGVAAEVGRYLLPAAGAIAVYLVHLGAILTLFLTFPFSKFAHALYRTLALAHERLAAERSSP